MSLESIFKITGFITLEILLIGIILFLIFLIYVLIESWFNRFYSKHKLWFNVLLGVYMNLNNKKTDEIMIENKKYKIIEIKRKGE